MDMKVRSPFLASAALAALAISAVAAPVLAKPAEGPARTFQPADLFGLEQAKDPQIRADGLVVAYVRSSEDVMTDSAHSAIWLVDVTTGVQTPLVTGAGSAFSPRWSPDGRRLAYVSTAEGRPQLYVRWIDTGVSARVAEVAEAPSSLAWSPDGKTLAFTMLTRDDGAKLGAPMPKPDGAKWAEPLQVIDTVTYRFDGEGYLKPGFDHIYTVSAEGGAPRQLTFGAVNEGADLVWTPDGRALLFSANRTKAWALHPAQSDVFEVGVADGAVRQLTHNFGPSRSPHISPKGDTIAYIGFTDRHRGYENARLYVMDPDGGNVRCLTQGLDRSVTSPRWAADGRSVYVQYADHGVGKIARVTLSGHIEDVAAGLSGAELDRPYSGGQYSVSANGIVAFTQGAPLQPGDVAAAGGRVGGVRQLTHLDADLFFGKTLGQVTPLQVASSVDKLAIDAWMITPPDFDPSKKYPLILEILGGPFASYGPVFASELQLYAAAGYVVLYANPRGSTSYGFDFADQINDNYPSHDYDDLMDAWTRRSRRASSIPAPSSSPAARAAAC